jgi:hypothetical protein
MSPSPPPSDSAPNSKFSRIILIAGGLSIVLLLAAGFRGVPAPPEWLSHLCISIAVVAIVHLLDRYVFIGETREELARLSATIVGDVSGGTDRALKTLTVDLNRSVSERSEQLLSETKTSLNDILTSQSTSLKTLQRAGIRNVYASRGEASMAIANALRSSSTTEIRILGISLNDFCRGDQPTLHVAWQELKRRISDNSPLDGGRKLRIRMLLVDPESAGAHLRSYAESRGHETDPGRLETDVRSTAVALHTLQQQSTNPPVSFECKLYRLAPTMFLCHMDDVCFMQPYHFWTERIYDTPIPTLEYDARVAAGAYQMHDELRQHFDLIWEHASVGLTDFLNKACVGTDRGVGELGLVNVFTRRDEAAVRILQLLEGAKKKVLIQGISLKSFFTGGSRLTTQVLDLIAKAQVEIQVLILDPESEQAMYRGYRERLLQPQGRATSFSEYRQSGQHTKSRLFSETFDTITGIDSWIQDLVTSNPQWVGKVGVRLYASAPACFMLAVDDRVLVEPYNYGKIGVRREGVAAPTTLGTDMPLFEYCASPSELYRDSADPLREPYELQLDHFRFAFEHATPIQLGKVSLPPSARPPLRIRAPA